MDLKFPGLLPATFSFVLEESLSYLGGSRDCYYNWLARRDWAMGAQERLSSGLRGSDVLNDFLAVCRYLLVF